MKFSITDFFSKCDQICIFTEEIRNGKLHFCAVNEILSTVFRVWNLILVQNMHHANIHFVKNVSKILDFVNIGYN